MILLDTNYLILSLSPESPEWLRIANWHRNGEPLMTSSIVWYEFTSGPVELNQQAAVRNLLSEVRSFDETQGEKAAELWNLTGRRRDLRVDAMIAAAAIQCNATLATNNQKDFEPFASCGLRLL